MASVNDTEAREMTHAAHDLGMDVLVEVHNGQELERALPLEPKLVGINNLDLRTFEVSLKTTEELAVLIPKDRVVVSEAAYQIAQTSCASVPSGSEPSLLAKA
jgi:indole-3-glycerol phosphate synthase